MRARHIGLPVVIYGLLVAGTLVATFGIVLAWLSDGFAKRGSEEVVTVHDFLSVLRNVAGGRTHLRPPWQAVSVLEGLWWLMAGLCLYAVRRKSVAGWQVIALIVCAVWHLNGAMIGVLGITGVLIDVVSGEGLRVTLGAVQDRHMAFMAGAVWYCALLLTLRMALQSRRRKEVRVNGDGE